MTCPMRGRCALVAAVLAALFAFPQAALAGFVDVPKGFWARPEIRWATRYGWIAPRTPTRFAPRHSVSRLNASRVLVRIAHGLFGAAAGPDPFAQAVAAGWISKGDGSNGTITQLEFDRGLVRVLGLAHAAKTLNHLQTADGWAPRLPDGFGVEQEVRAVGARLNVPDGFDDWELWPSDTLRRADVAVQAFQVMHMSSWSIGAAKAKVALARALPAWSPLKRKVLGFALRYAGAPYVWGGTSPDPQSPLGSPVAGGFDCSGFVWWVMKLQTYHAGGVTWTGNAAIQARTTYDMAASLGIKHRVPRSKLRPGDILFWSSDPKGVRTSWRTVYHAGIYLGNGWTVNSHGSGAGVTIDYMGAGAGWFHDAFAFGWRVMPRGA